MTNVNKNNSMDTSFTFRSKFGKLLNDQNRNSITFAFKKFCNVCNVNYARKFLWSLTYDANIARMKLFELGLNSDIISSENISTLRNELRYQYKQLHQDFLTLELPINCQQAFEDLENHSDCIIANTVYERCICNLYLQESSINRILFLLASNKERMYFGGIRALGFDTLESEYLKPFHKWIYDLLMELYKDFNKKENTSKNVVCNETDELPKVAKKSVDDIIAKSQTEESIKISEFKSLTLENILAHKELFTSFVEEENFNILLQIGKLGFDLNQVMNNKNKVYDFIKAAEALTE